MEVNGGVWLPEDVIFAVLSWLPVKPLCRFRCVSTAWRAIISSPAFTAAQRLRAAPLLVGAFAAAPPDEPEKTPGGDDELELRVMDADGNVLRVLRGVMGGYDKLLTTRLDLVCVDKWSSGASVIDPASRRVVTVGGYRRRPVSCSFGRAAASGAYKVLRLYDKLLCVRPIRFHFCEVATLGDAVDEETEPDMEAKAKASLPYLLVCKLHGRRQWRRLLLGSWHVWGPAIESRGFIRSGERGVVEWKKMIHGPELRHPKSWEQRWSNALGELKGALCWVETILSSQYGPYTLADVWVLVDSERSIWVKQYTIRSPDSLFIVKPLEVLRHGRLLLLKTIEEEQGEPHTRILQLYDPSTGGFTDLKMMPNEFRGMITIYTGSILSQL